MIIESRNATFFEETFPCKEKQRIESLKRTIDTATSSDQVNQESNEPRRSKRAKTSKSFGPDFLTYLLENEPQSYRETMTSPEAPLWKEAINSEIDSILQKPYLGVG